jgi:hypothetical protein
MPGNRARFQFPQIFVLSSISAIEEVTKSDRPRSEDEYQSIVTLDWIRPAAAMIDCRVSMVCCLETPMNHSPCLRVVFYDFPIKR